MNYKTLFFALLQTTIRWYNDQLTDVDKVELRRTHFIIFPGDEKFRPKGEVLEDKEE